MPQAKLTIRPPEDSWIHEVTTTHPESVIRVVSVLSGPNVGTALAELRAKQLVPVLSHIERQPNIKTVELLRQYNESALILIETETPLLISLASRTGVPIEMPFDVQNGVIELSITTSNERLSKFGTRLDESDLQYEARAIKHDVGQEDRLTDRQRDMLLTAVEQGYFEIPRQSSLTEVAESMDIAKATASDLLHRAESKLVDWYLENHSTRARTHQV